MPWKMVKKGHPWQGGPDRFVREFFPLSPYQLASGLKESGQLSDLEAKRWHNLELEEDLAESASAGAGQRAEPARGEITAEELAQDRREKRRILGNLEGGYFT